MQGECARAAIAPIRAHLLGPIDVRAGERLLIPGRWPRRHARSILLLLLAAPGHRLPRDAVLDELWPDLPPDAALNAFYKAVHALRRALEPDLRTARASSYIDVSQSGVALRPHPGLWVDVERFEALALAGSTGAAARERLRSALAFYRGDFLDDERYVDWPVARRESLRDTRRRAVLTLAQLDREAGEPLAAIGQLEALLAADPTFEDAHRALIQAFLAAGQRAEALRQVERCRLALDRELGVRLDPETEALAEVARQASLSAQSPLGLPLAAPPVNLPGLPTPTIGREREISRLCGRIASAEGRMVTIIGPGGVGKSRLAIEAGRGLSRSFPDGVIWVELAAMRDSSLLHAAIASALRIDESPHRPVAELVAEALRRRPRSLLILDNLEHLPRAAPLIAALLANVPELRVLATSREPLRIRAETIYRLDPLPAPEPDSAASASVLRANESVTLFLQCARAWGGEDDRAEADLPVIAELCHRLEGLPLAIELAAARRWLSSPATILTQLDDRFRVLRDGPRDLPERHQALYATISWSYDLLTEAEQALFRGLAAFAGGIETDALTAIFGADGARLAESLVEKSLLQRDLRIPGRRLGMLESIREFAEELLVNHGEEASVRLRHARFFAGLVEGVSVASRQGVEQIAWVRRLERDQENIHLALATSLQLRQDDLAVRITGAMGGYWFTHGPTREARAWIEEALAIDAGGPSESLAWTALWGAALAWRMADAEAGERFEQRAESIWSDLGSAAGVARVKHALAIRLSLEGRNDESLRRHRANLPVFTETGDSEGIVFSLSGIACALSRLGRFDDAADHLEQALSEARRVDNLMLQSYVLARLPETCLDAGDALRAGETAVEAERVARLIGDRRSLPWASLVQAWLAYDGSDYGAALSYARAALAAFRDVGDLLYEWQGALACLDPCIALGRFEDARAYALEAIENVRTLGSRDEAAAVLAGAAEFCLATGDPASALSALATVCASLGRAGIYLSGARQARYRAAIAAARAGLPAPVGDALWSEGESLDPFTAVERLRHAIAERLDAAPDTISSARRPL